MGGTWCEKSQVLKRDERVHEGSERIWEYAKSLIEKMQNMEN